MQNVFTPMAILFLLLPSCSKDSELPDCIEKLTDDPDQTELIEKVRSQTLNGEVYYWLNTGAVAYDGAEYIVNNSCDTICYFCGFCLPPDCGVSPQDDWETIWER
jgi:hypothetical protein